MFIALIGVRIARLGTVPRIVTSDERDNLQVAYRILEGTGPGIFGFDWKPAPIFSIYPLAWCVGIFGDTVSDFRMFPVALSLLTVIFTYLLARRSMGVPAALVVIALLGTNLWFLHFSRTAWENMNAALFAAGACWATTKAIETQRWTWWVRVGVFVAFGLYGYFSGRLIFVAVVLVAVLAVALRQAPFRKTASGLVIAGLVSAALFAPQAKEIYDNWDYFNQRTEAVSIFNGDPYLGESSEWGIAAQNLGRNVRGLILMDPGEFERGYWARYTPQRQPPLDDVSQYLFWAGLVVAAVRWKRTYMWWPFFVPLFVTQVFSRGTPDLARAMVFAPFYFLFIGIAFDEVFRSLARYHVAWRGAALAAAAALVVWIGTANVRDYFDWQESVPAQRVRLPGADVCEFDVWAQYARDAARRGIVFDPVIDETVLRPMWCSPIRPNLAAE